MAYGLCTTSGYITADDIIAKLDANIPLQFAAISEVRKLQREGCRYSNQDFDVLSSAHSKVGKSEVAEYEQGWVNYWQARR